MYYEDNQPMNEKTNREANGERPTIHNYLEQLHRVVTLLERNVFDDQRVSQVEAVDNQNVREFNSKIDVITNQIEQITLRIERAANEVGKLG